MKNYQGKTILLLSIPLCILIIIVSSIGLFTPGFYSTETLNMEAQAIRQDMIDLFLIAPCLLIVSILAYQNNKKATMIWGGVTLFLTYTFVIYCFNIHFNKLFVVYCLCLGLSFYSFMFFLFTHYKENLSKHFDGQAFARVTGIYFLFISVAFYFLWLSEIIPATIQKTIPKSITDTGVFTNGVQVMDLSVFLPGIFIAGILLLKRIPLGIVFTPVLLTFFVLMDITIGMLAVVMKMKGVESSLALTAIMGVLALITLALLTWFLKIIKPGIK